MNAAKHQNIRILKPRTISWPLAGFTVLLAIIAGAPIAVLSMFIASPFAGWPL